MFIENIDTTYTEQQHYEPALAPRKIRNPRVVPLDTQQNQNETYCGGLLNRNDHFVVKLLKVLFAIPLFPFVLFWRLMCCTYDLTISFCSNQVYNCLVYCYGKFHECSTYLCDRLVKLCKIIWNALYCCVSYVCRMIWNVIKCLGRCSKYLLDMYAIFAINMIMKCAHLRSSIQEISSCITIPISLKVLVPLYFCFYNYCYIPVTDFLIWIATKLYDCIIYSIKKTASISYNYLILPFYTYILVNLYRLFKFMIVDILYSGIIVNLCRGLKWLIINFYEYILCKFLYELILVNFCKCTRWILVNFYEHIIYNFYEYILRRFLYEIILVNFCKATRWVLVNFYKYIIVRFLYDIILVNFGKLLKLIFYNFFYKIIVISIYRCTKWVIVEILYKIILLNIYRATKWVVVNLFNYIIYPVYRGLVISVKFILTNINRFMIQPLWTATKFLVHGIITMISAISRFMYNQILAPMGRLVKRIMIGTANLIRLMAHFIGQLSKDIWRAIKNFAQRLRG